MPGAAFASVWITGASTGIGRALALRLARDGSIVCASARNAEALASLADEASGLPGRIVPVKADVTDADAMRAAWSAVVATAGVPDLCVVNAGAFVPVEGRTFDADAVARQFDVNVFGVARTLEAAIPAMVGRGSGRIAVVASVAGYRGLPTASAYGATKAALINMCEALRIELAPCGIVVQVVNPGFVETPMTAGNDFPMPFLMPVEKAAEALHRGLLGDRFEITFPKRFTWFLKLLRILPYALYLPIVAAGTKRRR
jgi:NAD(P)-dependent dehydrogenase (short-subunit alcohol dehydrogenase family)